MTVGDIQRRFARKEITAKQAADESAQLHRWGRDNGLERFLLRLVVDVALIWFVVWALREP